MANILFSLTAKDFRFDYFRGSGKGGQKRNKTSSGVRCTHPPSGAVGVSDDTRSQHDNKRIAFQRMAESPKFKTWWKLEVAKKIGLEQEVKDYVEKELNSPRVRVEVKSEGKWVDEKEVERID